MLSVQPVHDTDSVYRDSIGVLADVLVLLLSRKPQCEKYGGLCRLLPSSFAPEAAALYHGRPRPCRSRSRWHPSRPR